MSREELITSNEYIEVMLEGYIRSGIGVKEMRKSFREFLINWRDELLTIGKADQLLSKEGEAKQEYDPDIYTPRSYCTCMREKDCDGSCHTEVVASDSTTPPTDKL